MNNKWLHLTNPTQSQINKASKTIGGDISKLSAAVLKGSVARLEVFDDLGLAIVFNVINKDLSSCVSSGVIINDNKVISICSQDVSVFNSTVSENDSKDDVLIGLLNGCAVQFFDVIKKLDSIVKILQASLYRSMKNKELIKLLDLQKTLIYFSSALKANASVAKRFRAFSEDKLSSKSSQALDEVISLFEDALDAAALSRDILGSTMDTFGSIISNNQNKVMKLLTALTIILTIPTVIGSLWGMNVKVPFANNPYGFLIILIATIAMLIPIVILMVSKRMM